MSWAGCFATSLTRTTASIVSKQAEVGDGEDVRGRLLALQIKSGTSQFKRTPGGWWFRPDREHVQHSASSNQSAPAQVQPEHEMTTRGSAPGGEISRHPQLRFQRQYISPRRRLAAVARSSWRSAA